MFIDTLIVSILTTVWLVTLMSPFVNFKGFPIQLTRAREVDESLFSKDVSCRFLE